MHDMQRCGNGPVKGLCVPFASRLRAKQDDLCMRSNRSQGAVDGSSESLRNGGGEAIASM